MINNLRNKWKLVCLVVTSSIIILVTDWLILFSMAIFLVIYTSILKPQSKTTARIYPLLLVSLSVILFQLIFNTSIDFPNRIIRGFSAATKIISLSLLVFSYTSTTSPSEIMSIFSFLPQKLRLMLTITFATIPIVIEESYKIFLIQNSRGFSTHQLNFVKTIIPLVIPLLHRTLRRGEQIAIVLQSRGYDEG